MRSVWFVAAALVGVGACGFNPSTPAPDAAPQGDDADLDGIRDADDNCPQAANPDQHDEDRDGPGDVCDNCPHVANPTQANVGETGAGNVADGAGDACDPLPSLGGNDIVFFESFARPFTGWGVTGAGLWATADDSLSQTRDSVVTVAYVGVPLSGAIVDTTATLIAAGASQPAFGFGPVALFTPSIAHGVGYACDLVDNGQNSDALFNAAIEYLDSTTYAALASDEGTGDSLVGTRVAMRVMAGVDAPTQTCNVTSAAGLDLAAVASDTRMTPGRIALRTHNAAVRFDHVVVYSLEIR